MLKKVAIHPGEILKDELDERGLSQAAFAAHIGTTGSYMSDIINGRRGISAEMAYRIGNALGTGPELWYNLQKTFELASVDPSEFQHIKTLAA